MFKKILKSLQIGFLLRLKKIPLFSSVCFIMGEVETEHYIAKTGKTVYKKLSMGLVNYNAVDNELKYALAALISTAGNIRWIGTNGLIVSNVSATAENEDGIGESDTGYPYITTKDSGGTGSQNWVKFKGVRTAAGAETHTTIQIGLSWGDGEATFVKVYAEQSITKTMATGDVLTIYWKLTAA